MTVDPKSKKTIRLGAAGIGVKNFEIRNVAPGLAIETIEALPEESPVYSLIGQITANWAILEHTLNEIIWTLAEVPEKTGACLTAQFMNHTQRLDTIIALSHIRGVPKKLIDQAKELKQKLFNAADSRNRTVHDPWLEITTWTSIGNTNRPAQFKSMDKKGLTFGPQDVKTDTLKTTLAQVNDRIKDCSKFRLAIYSALRALQEKPQ